MRAGKLKDMAAAFAAALSFLTVLPAPRVEWTRSRLRYFPLAAPLAGAVIGALGALLFSALRCWNVSDALRAVVTTLFYLAVTGGLHMDGFMDTCDAVFSRKERGERLKILSDTHTGAFAVMGCAAVLLLKAGIFSELFAFDPTFPLPVIAALALIPVYSRLGVGLLFFLPFAREDGLARTLGAARVFRGRFILWGAYALVCACGAAASWTHGVKYFLIPFTGAASLVLYRRYCVKIFGGVTGDLMGAYVELSEVLMLMALAAVK